MLRNYDAWLTVDQQAEIGDQVIAYDFEGNPVTEGELPYYYSVEGELVPKNDEQALKDFLDMDLSDYQDFLKERYLVTEPTPQDFQ